MATARVLSAHENLMRVFPDQYMSFQDNSLANTPSSREKLQVVLENMISNCKIYEDLIQSEEQVQTLMKNRTSSLETVSRESEWESLDQEPNSTYDSQARVKHFKDCLESATSLKNLITERLSVESTPTQQQSSSDIHKKALQNNRSTFKDMGYKALHTVGYVSTAIIAMHFAQPYICKCCCA